MYNIRESLSLPINYRTTDAEETVLFEKPLIHQPMVFILNTKDGPPATTASLIDTIFRVKLSRPPLHDV